jgi:hypothetical protein
MEVRSIFLLCEVCFNVLQMMSLKISILLSHVRGV